MPTLTFNSVPLVHDFHREADSFLERYQRLDDRILRGDFPFTSSWQSNPNGGETNIGLPIVNWPKSPPLRLNQLYWPVTGASRWAEGLFLCVGGQVSAIDSCATSSAGAKLVWSDASAPYENELTGTDERGISWAEMWPVNYHRIAGCEPGADLDPQGLLPTRGDHEYDLYAIHLVDRRWWWQFIDAPDVCQHLTSWQDLIDYLCGQLGIVAYFAPEDLPLPSIYTTLGPHPGEWVRPYHNAAQLLDAALESIGARLVAAVDVQESTPSIWKIHRVTGAEAVFAFNISNAGVGFTNLRDQLAGTDCEQARARAMPAYVRTLFPKSRYGMLCGTCSTSTPTDSTDDSDEDCHESYHVITHSLQEYLDYTVYCPVQATAKTIHIRGWADMGQCDDADPMNNLELVALANQIASDWFLYHRRQYDFTTVGPTAWDPCGYDDSIIHKFGIEYEDGQQGIAAAPANDPRARDVVSEVLLEPRYRRDITSRIQSLPINVGSDCQLHNTLALELPGSLIVKLNETIPKFVCDSTYVPGGGSADPGEVCGGLGVAYRLVGELGCDCLTPEKITAIDSAHAGQDYLVWVYNTDCEDLEAGECVDTGPFRCCARRALVRCHPSVKSATATSCILPGSTTGTATLPSGTAIVIDNSDCLIMALPGDSFPVVYGGCSPTCTWKPVGQFGTTRWVRVHGGNCNESPAGLGCCESREVYVLEDDTDAAASGGPAASGGGHGCCTKRETECAITVCNTTNRMIASDKEYEDVLATLMPGKECLWYLHEARRPHRARAQLLQELCGSLEALVINWEYLDVCEWEVLPEPVTVFNFYQLYACQEDYVELSYNEPACRWEIVTVPDHELPKPMLDIKCHPDPDVCTIQRVRPEFASYGHSCKCDAATLDDDTQMTGDFYDIPTSITQTPGYAAASLFSSATCGTGDCAILFGTTELTSVSVSYERVRVCLYCPKEKAADPLPLYSGIGVGEAGDDYPLNGTVVDIPTSIKATWEDGSGGSGADCPTDPGTISLRLSIETTGYCMICGSAGGSGSGGTGAPGTPIEFPLEFTKIEPVVGVEFDCTGCPTQTVSTQGMFGLCVDAEPTEGEPVTCVCDPCTSGGS